MFDVWISGSISAVKSEIGYLVMPWMMGCLQAKKKQFKKIFVHFVCFVVKFERKNDISLFGADFAVFNLTEQFLNPKIR